MYKLSLIHLNIPEGTGAGLFSLKAIPGVPGKDQLFRRLHGVPTTDFSFPYPAASLWDEAGPAALQTLGWRGFRVKIISTPPPTTPKTNFKPTEQWHANPLSTSSNLSPYANGEGPAGHAALQQIHAEGWAPGWPRLNQVSPHACVWFSATWELHWLLAAQAGGRAEASALLLLSAVDLPILFQQAKFSRAMKPTAKGCWIPRMLLDTRLER